MFKKCTSACGAVLLLVNQLFCDDLVAVLAVLTDLTRKGILRHVKYMKKSRGGLSLKICNVLIRNLGKSLNMV